MLGAAGNDLDTIVKLAIAEQTVSPLRYIATAAIRFEPDNTFWTQMLNDLPAAPLPADGVMPHPTRFVSMNGMTRAGIKTVCIWLRPGIDLAAAHG